MLLASGTLTAVVTTFCGPIAFLGLAVPHMARLIFKTDDFRVLIPAVLLCGSASALACNAEKIFLEIIMNEKERILYLREQLHEHNYKYYVLNQPDISDQEFDFLMHELQNLEAKHPEMYDANSPTQRVGSDLNQNFTQVAHKYPMLSLANTYNEQDVADWYESVSRGLGGEPLRCVVR